jgi:hypothetical protein
MRKNRVPSAILKTARIRRKNVSTVFSNKTSMSFRLQSRLKNKFPQKNQRENPLTTVCILMGKWDLIQETSPPERQNQIHF